jgi:hypothetical protein
MTTSLSMRLAKAALVLAASLVAAEASAECLPDENGQQRVVIRTHEGKRLKGVLVCVDAEKAIFVSGHTTRNVPRSTIESIVTAGDPLWNGLVIGLGIGLFAERLGSHEEHLRADPPSGFEKASIVLGFGGMGALIDALRHRGGRMVPLPTRRSPS